MSDRDHELDGILEPLMRLTPRDQSINKWAALKTKPPQKRFKRVVQIAVAASIGFVIGAISFGKSHEDHGLTENFDSAATIESVYSKTL